MIIKNTLLAATFILALVVFTNCTKEDSFVTDSSARLEFSVDTIRFDTVFTELGSATRFVKVYNRHKESIKISRVFIESGATSKFRLNVDGIPGNDVREVVIYPEDSLYVFGEVTIDPDQPLSESPFVINDAIVFETNGNQQTVTLEAWGQNANYIPSRFHKDSIVLYTCNFGEMIWDDPKPYVIYGILVIDECTLTIPAGAQIHVHGGISKGFDSQDNLVVYNSGRLFFGANGRLDVKGTLENPVVIQGDRLEEDFADADGQWTGIIFGQRSKNNHIEHAIIKNSLLGVLVDSSAELTIKNAQIFNTSGAGMLGFHSKITAENCLIFNNGNRSLQLGYGGDYTFTYCTFASFGVDAPALSMSNGICDDPLCSNGARIFRLNAFFKNSIIFGSRKDEISLSDFTGGEDPATLNYRFENCIVRVDELTDEITGFPDFFDNCEPCINASSLDALFVDANEDDYHLDTLSVAEQMAMPVQGITIDLEGEPRDAETPDIGCFEYRFE